jgi:hypothetical protein
MPDGGCTYDIRDYAADADAIDTIDNKNYRLGENYTDHGDYIRKTENY